MLNLRLNYGLNSLRCFGAKVWDIVPEEIKNLKDLDKFKRKIRHWEPKKLPLQAL